MNPHNPPPVGEPQGAHTPPPAPVPRGLVSLKPDFAQTSARFAAWWQGEIVDRPPVSLGVRSSRPCEEADRRPAYVSLRDRWLDVEEVVRRQISAFERATWVGDSFPAIMPNVGPDLTATLWGVQLEFGENTSWSIHTVDRVEDWHEYLERPADFSNPYWRAIEAMTARAHELNNGRYLIQLPDLHGAYDILVCLRGPDNLCLDIADDPELVRKAGLAAARMYREAFLRCHQALESRGYPSTTWTSYLHPGPAYVPSCDFWCLVSNETARNLILDTILIEMESLERSIFHLDGPQALRHLDTILGLERLNAVQWVFGAGNGPASRWIDVYRRCLAAGKSVQVLAESPDDALHVLRQIGPKGVWLNVGGEPFADAGAAERFLEEVASVV